MGSHGSPFLVKEVKEKILWIIAEVRCMIRYLAFEISPSELTHYEPTVQLINSYMSKSINCCHQCNGHYPWEGYYVTPSDILIFLQTIGGTSKDIEYARSLMEVDFILCTDCVVCSLVHKSPKKLLLSILEDMKTIREQGSWPVLQFNVRERDW
jgi:hypothetical protein